MAEKTQEREITLSSERFTALARTDNTLISRFSLVGIVCSGKLVENETENLTEILNQLNQEMTQQARNMNATNIYGIKYKIAGLGASKYDSNYTSIIAYGDAYRKTK